MTNFSIVVFFLVFVKCCVGTIQNDYIDDCSQLTCPINGAQVVYVPLSNCVQFCQCSNGIAYTKDCLNGLQFNPNGNICDWPANVGCTPTNNSNNDNNGNYNDNTDSNTESNNSGSTGDICIESGIKCPVVDGQIPVYGALSNCSQFCQCSNGKPYLHNCSAGTHFNPTRNICDFPYRAGCGANNNSNSVKVSLNNNTNCNCGNLVKTGDVCLDSGIKCPIVDGDFPVYGALPNCSQFCQCSNGKPYLFNCSVGEHFNPARNVCDFPYRAGCTGNTSFISLYDSENNTSNCICNISNNDDNNGNNNDSRDSNTDSNNSVSLEDVCIESGIECPVVDGLIPVYGALTNCSQFCQCSNGKPYLHNCSAGTHFNPTLNICDFPYRAGCIANNNSNSENVSLKNNTNCNCGNSVKTGDVCLDSGIKCPTVDGDFPVYGALPNCSQFCQCSNGKPYLFNCSVGEHFNPARNVCDYPYRAGCTGNTSFISGFDSGNNSSNCICNNSTKPSDLCLDSGIKCPTVHGEYPVYGALGNVSQFCQCLNGKPYLHNCSAGLQFNSTMNLCMWPYSIEDYENEEDYIDDGYDCGEDDDNEEENPFAAYSLNLEFSLPKISDNEDCAGISCPAIVGDYTIFAPASNCSQFCKCSNGLVQVIDCPPGTHFNQELNMCDFPENVNCL